MQNIIKRTWDEYNLGDDAELDKYGLDEAARIQSSLMVKWLDLLAQAQDDLNEAKTRLADKEAELQLRARTGACEEYGKLTESVIKSWVTIQPSYKKAVQDKNKAESDVTYLQNAKTVLEHKKAMIQIEANLWTCGYFSRPSVCTEVQNQHDNDQKTASANKLRDTLRKRKHALKREMVED